MDLSVKYMGLNLKNPIIVGSSGLTNSVEKIIELEKNGAGAVVLKSIFEEQILMEAANANAINNYDYPEALDYIKSFSKQTVVTEYVNLIKEAKKSVEIPIIASINCVTVNEWTSIAKTFEEAGADAIELNISLIPTNIDKNSADNEKIYFEIIDAVKKQVKIPLALKMSHYSAGLANLIQKLSWTKKVDAFVLFNRYYNPDIDIDTLKIASTGVFSRPEDISDSLRWVAVLSDQIQTDIAASTGIHDAAGVIKQILAGATSVQVVSTLYKNGTETLKEIISGVENWMKKHNYTKIEDFKGKVSYKNAEHAVAFDRIQFMKYFGGIE
jgi:dihydroorotate dehydrogenase (fumarate)